MTPSNDPSVILIVEDNLEFAEQVALLMRGRGYLAVPLHSGAQTLAWLGTNVPALMILEYSLPDMRADQLIAEISARGKLPPFIIATGHGSEAIAVEMMKLGASDYLIKGTSFFDLLPKIVERVLEQIDHQRRLELAEQLLRSSQERLALAVEVANVGMWDWDLDTNEVWYSPQWKRQLGYEDHEIPAELAEWEKRLHPDDRARAVRDATAFQRNLAEYLEFEFRLQSRSGAYRWIFCRSALTRKSPDGTRRVFGVNLDITEQKLAEEAMRLQALTFENISDGLVLIAADGTIIDWNPAAVRVFGYTKAEAVGCQASRLLSPAENARLIKAVLPALRDTKAWRDEVQIVRKDGSIGNCEATIRTLQDSENKLVAYVCAIRDVSDRKRTEEALRQSEERYRQLVENAPDAIYVNHEWKIVYVNNAAVQLFGASSPRDLLGRDVLSLFDPAFWELIRERNKNMFAEWSAVPLLEERIVRLDGARAEVEVVAAPCVYNGAPASQVMLRDISRRKRAEEAVREKQAELAHVMRLNTMGNMVSQLAHEINQPLYAINNYAAACRQLLQDRDRDCPGELREWIQKISEQATRAGEIIRRLSHFVRKTPPQRSPALLHAVIRRIVELVEIDARLDRVQIRLELKDGLQRVIIDRVQIEQVLVNLVVNAIEAMESTALELREVVLSCVSQEGYVEVAVSDAGPGVNEDQMDRLFEPFFTTKNSGMGMGLSISRSIIEAHGGKLWATKNADRGMTFRFTLPLSDASAAAAN